MGNSMQYPIVDREAFVANFATYKPEVFDTLVTIVDKFRSNVELDDLFNGVTRAYASNLIKLSKYLEDMGPGDMTLSKELICDSHIEILRLMRDLNLNIVLFVSLMALTDTLEKNPGGNSTQLANQLFDGSIERIHTDAINSLDTILSNYAHAGQALNHDVKSAKLAFLKGLVNNGLMEKFSIPMNVSIYNEINLFFANLGIFVMRDIEAVEITRGLRGLKRNPVTVP